MRVVQNTKFQMMIELLGIGLMEVLGFKQQVEIRKQILLL
jgi:hypothetical protein